MPKGDRVLADRLLEWMGAHDMSARRFAHLAGVDEGTVYGITGRKRAARTDTLAQICRAHHISADWLLGLEDEWKS